MAPLVDYAVTTALSAQVLSHDEGSILVEAGGAAAAGWFLEQGLRPNNTPADESDSEPPSKRRKVTKVRSVEVSDPGEEHHIPVARVTIDLHFPETLNGKVAKKSAILEDVDFEEAEPISVVPAVIDLFDDGARLKLSLRRRKGAVLMVDTTGIPNKIRDALRRIAVSRIREPSSDTRVSPHPATWPRCTLSRSHGQLYTVLRFEATLYWQSRTSGFPSGVPVGKARSYPDYDILSQAFPDTTRDDVEYLRSWSPQDFYNNVHVPSKERDVKGDFDGVLESQLYPFQKRAVHWMLEREQVTYDNGEIRGISKSEALRDTSYYQAFEDLDGNICYVNHLQGVIRREAAEDTPSQLLGGLLAEEMGLGKTVELLALLSLHKRRELKHDKVFDAASGTEVKPSKATLIITPNSILQQWMSELARHAPTLKVLHYEGVSKVAKKNQDMISEMTANFDVVVTTYNTLAREVHFAEDPPKRNMRHARKFERMRSPLVQIQWWRICLDEAQMVESGVTAAARVACRLPRVNSWAVTGTPLRKDVQDLLGLLIFLRYRPFSEDVRLWSHLITNHRHLFRQIFGQIALRHTKAHIREDLQLPPQKRVVITVPFTAVEQQHYSTLFGQMCEDLKVQNDGSPTIDDWDPSDPKTVEAMRTWLVRLRQTCLHPQVGGRNRKALGKGQGPLRTVAEVLEVMIDQNETALRVEERTYLSFQLTRAHILGNARDDEHRSEKALHIYLAAMKRSEMIVKDARQKLAAAKQAQAEKGGMAVDTEDEDSSSESTPILGRLRNSLRISLQLQHACTFFAATAYYQIKANETLTTPESDQFKALEEKEVSMYEQAKVLRNEILKDNSRKSESLMKKIDDLAKTDTFTKMPKIKDFEMSGIESRRITEKSDDLFDVIRDLTEVITKWRAKMADYLLKPLVDKDEGNEITGDEYEDSTKQQDELYAYFDAIKAMQADLNTFVAAEETPLIDHEVKAMIKSAKARLNPNIVDDMKTDVHAPELTLELLATREKFKAKKKDVGSIKGLIQEARSLESSLGWYDSGVRAAEGALVRRHLLDLQKILTEYTKTSDGLEKEIGLFRATQNQRIEFYRQLQELSDTVKPHKEELDGRLDLVALGTTLQKEEEQKKALAQLMTKRRFLIHLRDENSSKDEQKSCVICQSSFEIGVLTVCGHQFCKECILHWWQQSKNCPMCKRRLSMVDFHNVTYKAQEVHAQEELHSGSSSPAEEETPSPSRQTSIYSDADTQLMHEIKSIDLPASYGTKIDTLGRHLHWIREHDPGAKSIVFSQYREFLTVLATALSEFRIGYKRLGHPGALERFKSDPSVDCLLLDAKTDSSGMTLVNATHVFICEPLIQTAVELQAIARVHRIGQTRPTTVWMYLINDTVEESIYEISVARRLAHVQARQPDRVQKSRSATPAPLAENAIDAANSEEMQSAPISKLLVNSKGGGEVVKEDDLWQCLFGKAQKTTFKPSVEAEMVAGRHLRAEAAEQRRSDAVAGARS